MIKRLATVLICTAALLLFVSCASDTNKWKWVVNSTKPASSGMGWAKFFWVPGELGGKHYDKTAMMIPVRIQGAPYYFNFQFDLGADVTMIYGKNAKSVREEHPEIELANPTFVFGDFTAKKNSRIYDQDFGGQIKKFDTIADVEGADLGTIGADVFHDKVLIIDYPNERFSISEEVPGAYQTTMVDFTMDAHGRVVLPMTLRGETYKVMFDNGSSVFQLITSPANIDKFSKEKPITSMMISSWGKEHKVTGRPMKDQFTLGGQTYSDVLVYENPQGMSASDEYDAITGNALFYDKVLILDFKNKKMGLKAP